MIPIGLLPTLLRPLKANLSHATQLRLLSHDPDVHVLSDELLQAHVLLHEINPIDHLPTQLNPLIANLSNAMKLRLLSHDPEVLVL